MASQTLKEEVIVTVNNLEEDSVFQGLFNYTEQEKDADSIYEFDTSQLQIIDEAKLQVKEGKTQSQAKADRISILDYCTKRNGSKSYCKKLNMVFIAEIDNISKHPNRGRKSHSARKS